ncbi:MAG TPA: hypothetical protein VGD01_18235 [Candidatus Elarobacter sp.]|jgi:hypothetical protein
MQVTASESVSALVGRFVLPFGSFLVASKHAIEALADAPPQRSLVNEKFTDALERELLGETTRVRYR